MAWEEEKGAGDSLQWMKRSGQETSGDRARVSFKGVGFST